MKKLSVILASLSIMSLFLIIPLVSATTSNVWFDQNTEIIWKYTEEALDEQSEVLDSYIIFKKLNFTEVVGNGDHLNITGTIYIATEENVSTYGCRSHIWKRLQRSA